MSFEFFIPVARDDLLNKTGVSQYVVNEVLSLRELPGAVQDVRHSFRSKSWQCMVENFDIFFSVLCLQKNVDTEVKEDAWQHILKIAIALSNQLATILEEDLDCDSRLDNLNIVKMTCYLLCQYMEMFESEETKPGTNQVITKGKGKSKKKNSSMTLDWQRERESGMKTLLHLVQLNIHRLWDPPVVEDEFVSLVTNCCYKILENPEINYVVNKEVKDVICHIIGIMVKRYNHGLGASVKVIQLLQHFEHLVSPLATVVQFCVTDYGVRSIVSELMREIGRMDSSDLARDTSGTRSYSAFLVEVSEKVPSAILPNISLILCHLDSESYAMRNGVLGAIGEILIRVLSKDNLDDKMKTTREQFLEKLEDHIHDIHALVRSKVLQIWLHIVNEKCLPLPHQEHLLSLVIGRLQDKSSQVRRYAIQLITALLTNNPFASKLSIQELELSYEKEAEKLKELMPEGEESFNESFQKRTEEEWKTIEKSLTAVMKKMEEDEDQKDEELEEKNGEEGDTESRSTPSLIGEDEPLDSVLNKIYGHLTNGQLKEAVKLMTEAMNAWPDLTTPHKADQEGEEEDEEDKDEDTEPLDTITCLQHLFHDKKQTSHALTTAEAMHGEQDKEQNVVNEVTKQQVLVQYLKESLAFAAQLQKAVPVISLLLGSKNLTDIMEAIEFFVTGFEFGLTSTMIGIRRMLPLIWAKEQGVKEAVVMAYKRLYLNPQGGNQRSKAQAVVKNLSALTMGATLCDLTSLEGLMMELVKSGEIEQGVIQMLWERFTMKIPGTTEEDSRAALQLISMVAGADMAVVKSNIDILVKEGLGPRADKDFLLARDTCLALLKLSTPKKIKGSVGSEPYRLAENHEMFESLSRILVGGVGDLENRYWIPLMEQAVNVIYKLGESPDLICSNIIKKLSLQTDKPTDSDETEGEKSEEGEQSLQMTFVSGVLTRLISLVGHVALRQLVHLDVSIFGEMKRRRAIQEQKAWIQTPASKRVNETNKSKEGSTTENIDEEMGLAGAAAEDTESEYILKVCETEVVTGTTLLTMFAPLLVAICTNQKKYTDTDLQTAASLALAKFMMVSSNFCDQHLQLLFTVLEKSTSPVIRANTIIAMGDLCFRFPNLIEPWTPHLYARLRDESTQVRKNTMQVLTHLILNDMLKVKGHISEMATCIVDHDDRISSLAKLFFHELSKKGNAIYNIMPDVISRLSDPDVGVDEDHFRTIMKYLFSFIQKDKHCESLVEKLCHRYRASRVDRQWRDLSYCLSMLSYSEKSLRKLQENFMCFADKLADDEVYSCFCTIIHKSRSFAKTEAKSLIDELEQKLEACHKKGMNEDELAARVGMSPDAFQSYRGKEKSPGKKNTKTPARKALVKKKSRRATDESDEELEVENVTPAPRATRGRVKKKRQILSFSDDEDSDIELFEVDKTSKKKDLPGKENASEGSDSEPLTPQVLPRRAGKNKRRLNSLKSPLSLNNTPL